MEIEEEDVNEAKFSFCGGPIQEQSNSKPQEPSHDESGGYEPHNLSFLGLDQDPENYLRWERGLEDWFRFYKIPKEERLAHAIKTLEGEANTWWIKEEALNCYNNPITTWGVLKQRMYREFVQKSHNHSYIPKRLMMRSSSPVWIPIPKKEIVLDQQPTKNQSNEQGRKILGTKSSQGGGNDEAIMRTKDQLEHLERTEELVGQALKPSDPSTKYQPPTLEDQRVTKSKRVKEKPPDPSTKRVTESKRVKEKPPDPSATHQPPNHMLPQGRKILGTKSSQGGGNDEVIRKTLEKRDHLLKN